MGNEHANQVGREFAVGAGNAAGNVGVVGKQSLASQDVAVMPSELVERVKARAGTKLVGAGGYEYVVTPEGAFRITKAPDEKYKGRVVTQMGYPKPWSDLAASLDQQHPLPAAPQAPTAPAPAPTPKPVAPPPPPEPSLLDRAVSSVESGLHDLKDGANALWDRATSWMHSDSPAPQGAATPATPATPATAPTAATPAPNKPPVAQPQAAAPRAGADGDTLGHALSRATPPAGKEAEYTLTGLPHADALRLKELAAKGTLSDDEKKEKDKLDADSKAAQKVLAADLMSGRADVWRFYCSGLSVWSLAAAGVDVGQHIKAPDGQEYKGEVAKEIPVDANGKPVAADKAVKKKRVVTKTVYVTLKALVDGEPDAVEIMTRAKLEGKTTVDYKGTGYLTENADGKKLLEAGQGAAFAFAAAGIGTEVPQLEQKPGDFAQCRHTRKDKNGKLIGAGHAWQVAEVTALGSALFGQGKRSPKTADNLDGWHANVTFTITHDTDPRLVGDHKVTHAVRVEAQDENVVRDKAADKNKDGGVQLTKPQPVPDTNPNKYENYLLFYGRLGTSPWNGWNAATKESATIAAASAPAAPAAATPAAATPAGPTAAAPNAAAPNTAAPTSASAPPAAPTPAAATPEATTPAAPTPAPATPEVTTPATTNAGALDVAPAATTSASTSTAPAATTSDSAAPASTAPASD